MHPAWQVVRFGEPADVVAFTEILTPRPGPKELVVQVAANGLNYLDVVMCRGQYPVRPAPPFVLGAELVGVVKETGANARAGVGDRIVAVQPSGYGLFRREAVVPDYAAFPLPGDICDQDGAALLVTYHTALIGLCRRAALRDGEWVLVHAGAGGLGSALIQVARAYGANVIATSSSRDKLRACGDLGATAVLNYTDDDLTSNVLDLTSGAGVNVICDVIGGKTFQRSLDCAAFEARILPLGWASGAIPAIDVGYLVARNISIVGLSWGSTYPRLVRETAQETHEELLRLYRAGAVKPFVSQAVDSNELPKALQKLADGRALGKLILRWDADSPSEVGSR